MSFLPRFFLLCCAAIACLIAFAKPLPVSAQAFPQAVSLAVDANNLAHVLWNNPDGSVSIWNINPDSSLGAQYAYGPYADWSGVQASTCGNANTLAAPRILWNHAPDGEAALFNIDSGGNASNAVFGPYSGWTTLSLAVGPDGVQHVLWNHAPDNQASLYSVNAGGAVLAYPVYGPFTGYKAAFTAVGGDSLPSLFWNKSDGSIALWKFAADGTFTSQIYPPSPGYAAVGMAVGSEASPVTHILWNKTDGSIAVWNVGLVTGSGKTFYNPQITYKLYGPLAGWTAKAIAAGPDSKVHLLWQNAGGAIALWTLNADGSHSAKTYSPAATGPVGFSVNGAPSQIGALSGAASGNDTVIGSGAFAGSFSPNPVNGGGRATVTVNSGSSITVPSGIYTRSDTKTRSVNGTTYTDQYAYNGLIEVNQGDIKNQGTIDGTFVHRPASTQVFGLDSFVDGGGLLNVAANQNYTFADGIFAWSGQVSQHGPTTIVNGSPSNTGAAIKGVLTGTGQGFANGIQALEYYGPSNGDSLTVQNYGTIDGEVQNHDGTATGVNAYSLYGGLSVTNYASGTFSAAAPYYATGIYGQVYYGDTVVQNDGLATAAASGGKQGLTANKAYAVGIDMFDYAGNVNVTNTGTATGATTGAATSACYGVFLWAEAGGGAGGTMTFNNSGTVTATSSSDAKTVYCGGNGGPQTVTNTGSITGTAGSGGGWALGVENDNSDPIHITNSGSISHNNGLGVGVFIGSGPVVIRNTGSIFGGLTGIAAQTFHGSMTIYDHGPLKCGISGNGAMVLGSGSDAAFLYGLPAVSGVLDGGGGSNALNFHLTGPLQSVNGGAATLGPNLSAYGLGTSGNIVVSGQTYAWNNFTVSGSTAAANIANGTYKIVNRLSGKAMGTHLSGTANGTVIEQWTYGGGPPQRWTVTSLGNGRYKIIGVGSGRALEVAGGTTDGAAIDIRDDSGDANQQWTFTPTDSGYYTITPANALGSCLDVAGASLSNGALITLWTLKDADAAAGGADQQWALQAP